MFDFITELLNLVDSDLIVTSHETSGNSITVFIEKSPSVITCPVCNSRMHSKGSYTRTLSHPVLQDHRNITLKVKKRKFKCPNCSTMVSDSFNLFARYKHSTNLMTVRILEELKDLTSSVSSIARRLNVSDFCIRDTFSRYVDMKRLPLTSAISVDEVFMNFDKDHKYPIVILDFYSGEPIDIICSRRKKDYEHYFLSIPFEERKRVKYLICDMYNPYICFCINYFPNAIAIVDCFHVVKWINDRLRSYIKRVYYKYKDKDKEKLKDKNYRTNRENKSIKESRECYILRSFKWVLLENQDHISYSDEVKWDCFLGEYLDTYQKEKMFLELDEKFKFYRDLKEKYINFNRLGSLNPECVPGMLEDLINEYKAANDSIFNDFARLLNKYKEYIINSFITVETVDKNGVKKVRRLSNGPIEGFNNKPKDLKRISKGVSDYDFNIQRLLWATRSSAAMLAVPKTN